MLWNKFAFLFLERVFLNNDVPQFVKALPVTNSQNRKRPVLNRSTDYVISARRLSEAPILIKMWN